MSTTDDVRLADDLVVLTRALVDVPSVSGAEAELADLVERRLTAHAPAAGFDVVRRGNCVVARTRGGRGPRVVLAGHLDTVPFHELSGVPQPACPDRVTGRGAVDMKGGVAVMLVLASAAARAAYETTYVFYDNEEVGSHRSGMNALFAHDPDLVAGDMAVLLEPTGTVLEAGCQGNLVVEFVFHGRSAHSARPWRGVNAVHRAAAGLAAVAAHEPAEALVDGLRFRPSISVVGVDGGHQGNVVPDRCVVRVNYRHPPHVGTQAAVAELESLMTGADESAVVLSSPPAPPAMDSPLVRELVDGARLDVAPKLGWTDVGRFAAHGIPAVNLGPGDSELAHGPAEVVHRDDLERCHGALAGFLSRAAVRPAAPDGTREARP